MPWRYKQKENEGGYLQTYDCSKTPITAVCNSCHTPYVNLTGDITCRDCRGEPDLLDEAYHREMENYNPYEYDDL